MWYACSFSISHDLESRYFSTQRYPKLFNKVNDTSTVVEKCLTIFNLEAGRSGEFSGRSMGRRGSCWRVGDDIVNGYEPSSGSGGMC